MKLSTPSLSLSLALTIILMGSITIALPVITGKVYRDISDENQRDAIRDLVGIEIKDQFEQLEKNITTFGSALNKKNNNKRNKKQ